MHNILAWMGEGEKERALVKRGWRKRRAARFPSCGFDRVFFSGAADRAVLDR